MKFYTVLPAVLAGRQFRRSSWPDFRLKITLEDGNPTIWEFQADEDVPERFDPDYEDIVAEDWVEVGDFKTLEGSGDWASCVDCGELFRQISDGKHSPTRCEACAMSIAGTQSTLKAPLPPFAGRACNICLVQPATEVFAKGAPSELHTCEGCAGALVQELSAHTLVDFGCPYCGSVISAETPEGLSQAATEHGYKCPSHPLNRELCKQELLRDELKKDKGTIKQLRERLLKEENKERFGPAEIQAAVNSAMDFLKSGPRCEACVIPSGKNPEAPVRGALIEAARTLTHLLKRQRELAVDNSAPEK